MKFKVYLVKGTESELNNYLEILGHGHASAACGTWYETIITEHETN